MSGVVPSLGPMTPTAGTRINRWMPSPRTISMVIDAKIATPSSIVIGGGRVGHVNTIAHSATVQSGIPS